ncbi:DNA-binding response regulator [Paenibacillus marchantiophytorum]|uniref:DNA-binding response regulator n=1 Tax=Paenibacillus marchantiophytorum TaxID=1619310 RepID=A0ABQ1FHW3_9BACL|nr:response regulator transcription factor [Paenibacillus marchantiophytorum]GGA14476.1 DNA-binding response regulator [Paenibacillus marchantiophytorum]
MSQPFRVLIVDDHPHAREGIQSILRMDTSFEIVAEGRNGAEAIRLTEQWMPDIILMDINMPQMDGLEATKQIKDKFPYVKIVMVTVSDDITHLFEALKKGAQGYLLKNLSPNSWHEYLKAIAVDEAPMSRELALRLLQEFTPKEKQEAPNALITGREREILEWVASGRSNRLISEGLGISEYTVKNHLKNIMQKLQMDNRVQLTRYVFEQGWLRRMIDK